MVRRAASGVAGDEGVSSMLCSDIYWAATTQRLSLARALPKQLNALISRLMLQAFSMAVFAPLLQHCMSQLLYCHVCLVLKAGHSLDGELQGDGA
jgi:hypothetical protein